MNVNMDIEEIQFGKCYNRLLKCMQYANNCKYYHDIFKQLLIDVNKITYRDFKRIPITCKDDYRNRWFDFFTKELCNNITLEYINTMNWNEKDEFFFKNKIRTICTSGSTGKPLIVYRHLQDEFNDYFYLNKFRSKINRNIFKENFVWIWPINSFTQEKIFGKIINFRQINVLGYQYFLYEYSDSTFNDLYEFIINNTIRWITAPPSVLALFSQYLINKSINLTIDYIECHSEFLHLWQKKLIGKAMNAAPVNIYSSNEMEFMGITCKYNNLHVITDNVYIELLKNKENQNEVVVTGLNKKFLPLIKYNLGDLGDWNDTVCRCEFNNYPILNIKAYRSNDYIINKFNSKFEPYIIVDALHYLQDNFSIIIEQFQVIQKKTDYFLFYIKSNNKNILSCKREKEKIIHFLSGYFRKVLNHRITIKLEIIDDILPINFKNGKFKYFINDIKDE